MFSFLYLFHFFSFFLCLIVLAKISGAILNKSGELGHLPCSWFQWKCFGFLLTFYLGVYRFAVWSLCCAGIHPSIPTFCRACIKKHEVLWEDFLCLLKFSYDFCHEVHLCNDWHWFIHICWTTSPSLERS